MAYNNATYGTKGPANINPDDCDIFYYFCPDRNIVDEDFKKGFKTLSPSSVLEKAKAEDGTIIDGMYNLKLPLTHFNKTGIYTIYIKPKELRNLKITDVGRLVRYKNIKGIVLGGSYEDGELVGYKVDYVDGNTKQPYHRLITSNYRCIPITDEDGNKSYDLTKSGSLTFCTLTPSTPLSFVSGGEPFIGKEGQEITLTNTKFNPIMFEVELVEHDIETVTTMLEGPQIRNLHNSTITTFNSDGEIYHQAVYGSIVDPNPTEGSNNNLDHDFRIPKTNVIDYDEKDNFELIKENGLN